MAEIIYLRPSELTPYFNNPRKNDDAVIKIAESIKAFGFQNPIITDKDKVIIAGHTRWKAALKLELETIPVIVSNLPEDKAKAYRIADNRLGEFAEWDWEQLDIEMDDFDEDLKGLLDFDINKIGESLDLDDLTVSTKSGFDIKTCPKCGFEF